MENIIKYISEHPCLNKTLLAMLSFILNLFIPILPIITVCFVVILIDLYYGLKVSHKAGVKIQSKYTWGGTLSKMRDSLVMIALGHLIEIYIIGAESPLSILVGTIALLITLTELWSILENLNTLNPSGPWRALSFILKDKSKRHLDIDVEKILKENANNDSKNGVTEKRRAVRDIDCHGDDCQCCDPCQE